MQVYIGIWAARDRFDNHWQLTKFLPSQDRTSYSSFSRANNVKQNNFFILFCKPKVLFLLMLPGTEFWTGLSTVPQTAGRRFFLLSKIKDIGVRDYLNSISRYFMGQHTRCPKFENLRTFFLSVFPIVEFLAWNTLWICRVKITRSFNIFFWNISLFMKKVLMLFVQ